MTATRLTTLIPARFLCLLAHLIMTIIVYMARDENVRMCLPPNYTALEYQDKDTQLVIALSIAFGMFGVEMLGFFSGISMFSHMQNGFSTCLHGGAAIALLFYLFDIHCADDYWYVFGFCNVLPAVLEVVTVVAIAGLKQGV